MRAFKTTACCAVLLSGFAVVGCYTEPTTPAARQQLTSDSSKALDRMKSDNPSLNDVLNNAYAYVILPDIGQGAAGVGGAHGHGEAYQGGNLVGYAEMTVANIGLQIGGQEYSELIVFRNKAAFDKFTNNNLNFEAGASATVLKSGAATEAKWMYDVAVFKQTKGGLEAGAAIGGQSFKYKPVAAQ